MRKSKTKKTVPSSQRKRSHKGTACRRGEPVYYDEKKIHCNLMLTPTAIAKLAELAEEKQTSRSEIVEQWLRSQEEIKHLSIALSAEVEHLTIQNKNLRQELREVRAVNEVSRLRSKQNEAAEEIKVQQATINQLQAELAECEAARDDFFDDADRYMKCIKEIEKQALTPEQCDRILKALQVGQQSSTYRRVAALLVEIYGKPWR
jgi:predicted RNase H-like nuclease (RuvC/YqgF family)